MIFATVGYQMPFDPHEARRPSRNRGHHGWNRNREKTRADKRFKIPLFRILSRMQTDLIDTERPLTTRRDWSPTQRSTGTMPLEHESAEQASFLDRKRRF